jgi:chromosome segregation ATPase
VEEELESRGQQVRELITSREQADALHKTKKKELARVKKGSSQVQTQVKKVKRSVEKLRPALMKVTEEIKSHTKKKENAEAALKKARADEHKHKEEVDDLEQELKHVQKLAARREAEANSSTGKVVLNREQLHEYVAIITPGLVGVSL